MRRLLFLVFVGLAGCAVLVGLGNWQVRRLGEKQDLLSQIETRIAAAPVAMPADPDPERDTFLAVQVAGRMLDGELHVLVSQKRIGAGYRIIAPFRTEDGRMILIDRGFVRTGQKDAPRSIGPMTITGNLHWPDEVDGFTPDPDVAGNIWFARDVPALAQALNTDPILVIARSNTDFDGTPLPVTTVGIPNDHLQYAVTWYGLAAVWAAMSIYFLWRSRAGTKGKQP